MFNGKKNIFLPPVSHYRKNPKIIVQNQINLVGSKVRPYPFSRCLLVQSPLRYI